MINKFFRDEKGQSMVLVLIFFTVLVGFAGIAIDAGRLYLAKSNLQKAVDAGALAGANVIVTNTSFDITLAQNKAQSLAIKNYTNSKVTYEPKAYKDSSDNLYYVQVTGKEKVNMMLMPLLGINNSDVNAIAKVKIGKINKIDKGNIVPIGIQLAPGVDLTFGDKWDLTSKPGKGDRGNYGLLDFSVLDDPKSGQNSGSSSVDYYIAHGSPVDISRGDKLKTNTGDFINSLKNLKAGMTVYVPIVSGFDFTKGPGDPATYVKVEGFAAFILSNPPVQGHTINATFIKKMAPGEIGDVTKEYGTYASALVM